MLLEKMKNKLSSEFPSVDFTVDSEKRFISIPSGNKDFGDIEILDDQDELTICVGKFTHWHAGCYDDNLKEAQKEDAIIENVTEFLRALFSDEIVVWGNQLGGGGFCHIDKDCKSRSILGLKRNRWVWSGPLNS
jgi:hypothetical protein